MLHFVLTVYKSDTLEQKAGPQQRQYQRKLSILIIMTDDVTTGPQPQADKPFFIGDFV